MKKKHTLACVACGSRNYTVERKENVSTRLETKKFCKHCNAHTAHKETI